MNFVSASEYTLREDNYNTYFDSDGNLISNTIQDGDTLDLNGNFNNKNFTITKNLTVTSKNTNANLNNCTVTLKNSASGSSISNLHIHHEQWYGMGIVLDGSSYNHIYNNRIESVEHGGVTITLLPNSNYNLIEDNVLNTTATSWDAFHETVVLFASNYNILRNNLIYCGDDNGIYASLYGRSAGIKSSYNQIINNTIICQIDNPSAWNYGIQMMGDYNIISENTVKNCFRAISTTSGTGNNIIGNKIDTVTGDMGIYSTSNSLIYGNTLTGINSDCGIYVGEGSTVNNNKVEASYSSTALSIGGSNVLIINNDLESKGAATIYGMGNYKNITIFNNNLKSDTGVVIQFKKQSSKKFISNVTVSNNIITTNSRIVVDAAEAKTPFVYEYNLYGGDGKIILPEDENSSSDGSGFNGKVYNITPNNYEDYFDSAGIIRPNTLNDGDTVYFIGEFRDKTLSISKRLKITGENPVFTNSIFRILESGCWIENITIINNNPKVENQWGLFISGANNITVLNNNIEVNDVCTAYAIYILDSTDDNITGNVFKSSGEFLTYTVLAYEVSNLVFTDNIILTNGTSEFYNFSNSICIDGLRIVPEIYRTYGFLGIYLSNSLISGNIVNATSGLSVYNPTSSSNSIVGIDLYYDANNNIISYNNVSIKALDSYIYGLGVLGSEMGAHSSSSSNNNFSNNNVCINGAYFVTGIIAGSDSYNTVVEWNILNLDSYDFVYGLTFEGSSNSIVGDNIVNASGSANYLIELFSSDNNYIASNILEANGTNSYGIAAFNSHNNKLMFNSISAFKLNSSNPLIIRHSDSISPGTSGIYFMEDSTGNEVSYNSIVTNGGYAVNLTNSSALVFMNILKAASLEGDDAVYPKSSNVYNNTGIVDNSVSLVLNPLVKVYGDSDKLTGSILDSKGNPIIGHHIYINLTRPSSGAFKVYEVISDYMGSFTLDIGLAPGNYIAVARYPGFGEYESAISDVVNVIVNRESSNKTGTILVTKDYNEAYGSGKAFVGELSTFNGAPLTGHHVSLTLTRLSSGASKTYDTVCDYMGSFSLDIGLAPGYYSVACSYTGTSVYQSTSSYNSLTIY